MKVVLLYFMALPQDFPVRQAPRYLMRIGMMAAIRVMPAMAIQYLPPVM